VIIKAFVVGTLFDTVAIAYCNSAFIVLLFIPLGWSLAKSTTKWLFIGSNSYFSILVI
jgi:hypothetical protein